MIDRLPLHLLGRHILRGPDDHSCLGGIRGLDRGVRARAIVHELGKPEVENLDVAVSGEKQILWLEIAMDDPARVSGRQAARHLPRDIERLALADRSAPEPIPQRLAFQALGDDV